MSDFLPSDIPRRWTPLDRLVRKALSMAHGVVVDLCPGSAPLPCDHAIRCGWDADGTDITKDRLPFEDRSVDFLYCRHTLEDLLDPCWALSEIQRVAKSGWIETPSATAEMCRGIDANSPDWRGYVHHRSLFWVEGDTLFTCAKYPLIEYVDTDGSLSARLRDPDQWNCVYIFGEQMRWKQLRHEVDYILPHEYPVVLSRALNAQAPQDTTST